MPAGLRKSIPHPIRQLLGRVKHYVQRLGRWAAILLQLRGNSWRDQLKLMASAVAAPVTSLSGLGRWQDPVMLFDANVRVSGIGCFQVRRQSDDLWHVLPWREQGVHRALREILSPGDVFVDAGANIGIYTLLASRLVGPGGRVIAIEMMPDTAAILRRHVEGNGCGNVEIIEKALSDGAVASVTARVVPGKYGQASIANTAGGGPDVAEREVAAVPLDQVCHGIEHIRLIKMDLEGAEVQALAGARATIERTGCVIYESHTDADELATWFESVGFAVSRKLGKDRLAERRYPSRSSR